MPFTQWRASEWGAASAPMGRTVPAPTQIRGRTRRPRPLTTVIHLRDQSVLIEQPPASPELNPAARVFEELRRVVEGKVDATLAEKVDAVQAEPARLAADPERVRRLTGWGWIDVAIRQLPRPCAA